MTLLRPITLLASVCLTAAGLLAHGGQYRGPSGISPAGPGSSGGSSSGSPSGVGNPGPTGPSTASSGSGQPSTSGGTRGITGPSAGAGPSTPAAPIGEDLTRWQYWWEFNKDRHINLKASLRRLQDLQPPDARWLPLGRAVDLRPPTRQDIETRIVPALLAILEENDHRDMVSGALVALAKVERDTPHLDTFRGFLTSNNQEIRETAALCLGISQSPDAVPDLCALFSDAPRGRELASRHEVDVRTRTFAGYGLGLVAWATPDAKLDTTVLRTLSEVLRPDRSANRNLRVAAVQGLRLLRPGDLDEPDRTRVREEALEILWTYHDADLGPGEAWLQAHALGAIATLLGRGHSPRHDEAIERMVGVLRRRDSRSIATTQSAALALGSLSGPDRDDVFRTLTHAADEAHDRQTRHFATLALGRIGGERGRSWLAGRVRDGRKIDRPWAALGLALAHRQAGEPARPAELEVVREAFGAARNPEVLSGLAVALGLLGDRAAAEPIRTRLEDLSHQDETAGYLCIALALLEDYGARHEVRRLVEESVRRPGLLRQAAVALGRLSDPDATPLLLRLLEEGSESAARLGALASAIGLVGDRRALEPLLGILEDEAQQPLTRAFAAVALGSLGDKEPVPWNAKIGAGINYRASVETLTNQSSGILDLF